jgi:DNA-binding NtrC family response regulator
MPNTRVLIVDDEEDFATALAERMTNRGLQADVAFNGESALEFVESKPYDAVVLDLAMPGMDGIETLKRMLAHNPDLQVIILTGKATVKQGVEAVREGAFEFLEKPVRIDMLVDKINVAKSKKAMLSEERLNDMINEIMKRRGW